MLDVKIICFGDSLTRGITYVKGRMRIIKDNYPNQLARLAEPVTGAEVVNKGVFNDNSELMMKRMEKDVLSEHPDMVLISVGGNDCNFYWDQVAENPEGDHEPIVPLDRYLENVRKLALSFQAAKVKPFLLTLPPLDPARYYKTIAGKFGSGIGHWISLVGGIEHWHGLYNRQLKLLAKEMNIDLIDVRSYLKESDDLSRLISDDGIHLTADGYKQMSEAVFLKLKSCYNGLLPGEKQKEQAVQ